MSEGIIIKDYGLPVNPDIAKARQELEAQYGVVWDTSQMTQEYSVEGFSMGIVVVTRKCDGVRGSLDFSHSPRFYFNFQKA